ncbi:sensor histidine kinase [Metabacillus bambusae]|uniref:Histidine kinase n=1 Tax=Metabacillus bambusae TaxID=2795218 RepID=A0ABS3NAP3_9BACI|nr:histidine kinase [Metabacillus bambusae]MBO1515307.1 histidine kinase [Metabacillus bambusae]
MVKYKIFRNSMIFLLMLVIPTTILFSYSHKVSKVVVRKTLEDSASKQLKFSMNQLEDDLRQVEMQSSTLLYDSSVKAFESSNDFSEYLDHLMDRKYLEEKLKIQRSVNSFLYDITIYLPNYDKVISTEDGKTFNKEFFKAAPFYKWFTSTENGEKKFHYLVSSPYQTKPNLLNSSIIIESTINSSYLKNVLSSVDASGIGTSFFYFSNSEIFTNAEIDPKIIKLLKNNINFNKNHSTTPSLSVLEMNNKQYLVQTLYSTSLEGTLVSFIELDEFLSPLENVSLLVNVSLFVFFITGGILTFILYRHFRLNIRHLIKKIELLGKGDYKSRVTIKANNEFDYLFGHFNNMAERIQTLIENVYEEQVRTREAEYKHLQSQINPHFLYNCLFYIISMARKSPDAVIAMADNLAKYYRYKTKKPGNQTSLLDEIKLSENYLKVQSLRNKRLHYSINIPEEMHKIIVPTLLLQPIIENAINHGFDQKIDSGKIQIKGHKSEQNYMIVIEDDGIGMSNEEINRLLKRINQKQLLDEVGCGLWNINQRLINQYGPSSGIHITRSSLGGLCIKIVIDNHENEVLQNGNITS